MKTTKTASISAASISAASLTAYASKVNNTLKKYGFETGDGFAPLAGQGKGYGREGIVYTALGHNAACCGGIADKVILSGNTTLTKAVFTVALSELSIKARVPKQEQHKPQGHTLQGFSEFMAVETACTKLLHACGAWPKAAIPEFKLRHGFSNNAENCWNEIANTLEPLRAKIKEISKAVKAFETTKAHVIGHTANPDKVKELQERILLLQAKFETKVSNDIGHEIAWKVREVQAVQATETPVITDEQWNPKPQPISATEIKKTIIRRK